MPYALSRKNLRPRLVHMVQKKRIGSASRTRVRGHLGHPGHRAGPSPRGVLAVRFVGGDTTSPCSVCATRRSSRSLTTTTPPSPPGALRPQRPVKVRTAPSEPRPPPPAVTNPASIDRRAATNPYSSNQQPRPSAPGSRSASSIRCWAGTAASLILIAQRGLQGRRVPVPNSPVAHRHKAHAPVVRLGLPK